jgi:hypothetical protein
MTGVMDDRGRLPGRIKFMGEGTNPKALLTFGMEKSFISLFRMIPVRLLTNESKLAGNKLTCFWYYHLGSKEEIDGRGQSYRHA